MQLQRKDLQIGAVVIATLVVLVGLWAILQLVGGDNGEEMAADVTPPESSATDDAPAAPLLAAEADPDANAEAAVRVLDSSPDTPVVLEPTDADADRDPLFADAGSDAPVGDAGAYWDQVFNAQPGNEPVVVTRTPEPGDAAVAGFDFDSPDPGASPTEGAGESAPAASADTRVNDAGQRVYTVRQGDSFYTIARDVLGDASLYRTLERANPQVNARTMRPGVEIVLPDLSERGSPSPTDDRDVRVLADPGKTYIVRKGQTLSHIAQEVYGESWMWRDLLVANERLLGGNPQALRPNMVLIVPELPTGSLGSDGN